VPVVEHIAVTCIAALVEVRHSHGAADTGG
jgi:hypothetical protein